MTIFDISFGKAKAWLPNTQYTYPGYSLKITIDFLVFLCYNTVMKLELRGGGIND